MLYKVPKLHHRITPQQNKQNVQFTGLKSAVCPIPDTNIVRDEVYEVKPNVAQPI